MSEHTEGRIEAFTQDSFSGWWALREKDGHEIGSGDGGLFEPDARRLAAAWNFCEDMKTETMEQAKKTAFAYMTDADQHAHKLAQELNAARALLREVYEEGNLDIGDQVSKELDNRIHSYLDACDTLEGK